jgi:hypothetical protein
VRWLAIGAVIGIAGYRRLAGHASSADGQPAGVPPAASRRLRRALATVARISGLPRVGEIPALIRDVRAGMTEYQREHRGGIRAIGVRGVPGRHGVPPGQHRGNITRQHGRSRNTLVSQRVGSTEPCSRARALDTAAPRRAVRALGAGGEQAASRPGAGASGGHGEASGGDGMAGAQRGSARAGWTRASRTRAASARAASAARTGSDNPKEGR